MKPYRLQSEEVKDMLYKLGYFDYFVQLSTKHDYYSQLFINMPTKNEIKKLPKNTLKAMWYTSSYQNIKTYKKK